MCGRTTLTITPDDLQRTFGYTAPADYRPRYNVAPTQNHLALAEREGQTGIASYRWGLVPFGAKDLSIGNRMITARAETVTEKAAVRNAFAKRRCLIVVDGFYEWQAGPQGKRPHRIRLRDRRAFTLAGLWESWGRGPQVVETCTILTTSANPAMSSVHDRMPVIIEEGARGGWLSGETPAAELLPLLKPYAGDDLDIYEVSTMVNSPANDRPECIEALDEPLQLA